MFKSGFYQDLHLHVPLIRHQLHKYLIIVIKIQTFPSEELKKMSIQDPSLYLEDLFSSSILLTNH